jgi:curli biogenesis system outer membrane secretion channel CsgG
MNTTGNESRERNFFQIVKTVKTLLAFFASMTKGSFVPMKIGKIIFTVLLWFCFSSLGNAEAANPDIVRLGVMKFASKADGISDRQAEIITDVFTRVLANSKTIAILERERLDMIGREHRLNMSGLVDMGLAVEVGRLAGCQYMILGAVTELQETASGGAIPLPFFGRGGIVTGNKAARATIDMRVVDVTTSEIVFSLSGSGTSSESAGGVSVGGISMVESEFGGLKARALTAASSHLAHKIREEVGGEYSYVLSSRGKEVQINLGVTSGVKTGDLYLVYADGREILDIDGNPLEREKHNIVVLKAIDVQNSYSVCDVVPEGGNPALVRRGQKIEPISRERARDLSKRKAFVKELPRSSGTFEEVFGDGTPSDRNLAPDQEEQAPSRPAPVRADRPRENQSTDPGKVVMTYPLAPGEANNRRIAHINARKLNGQKAYDQYCQLADSYDGDYLAAYRAGETAQKLRKKDEAREWYGRALEINPDYEPALKAMEKLK